MTSQIFTPGHIADMALIAGTNGFRVTLGDREFTTLGDALTELDAIYARREAIAVKAMQEYRSGERTETRKQLCFAPSRIAEQAQTEATNAILRACGMEEFAASC